MRVPSTSGVELAVHDLGGDGPTLLLAHANGYHGLVWRPLVAHLGGRVRALALDFRGHGDSPLPAGAATGWDGLADDVLAVVDHLGLDRPLALGHSMGGAALLLAEEARPETFAALYCYEPVVLPTDRPPPPDGRLVAAARGRRATFADRDQAYAHYAARPPHSGFRADALRAYVDHGLADRPDGGVALTCPPEHEARLYEAGVSPDVWSGLGRVACPVLVACGERTTHFGPAVVERVAAALPRGRVEVLPGLGHFGPLEDPAAVAASVARALAGTAA